MKIFITGGAGYIGSICTEELITQGYDVVVFDNLSEGHKKAVHPKAKLITGDFNDYAQIELALNETKPDAIMHFAANALVGESMTNPYKYFRNNVGGGLNILEAAAKTGVKKFVFSSTCATYGVPETMPMTEALPQHPINPYGESKLLFEKILRWYDALHGVKFVILRYFNAAGASEQYGEDHRIETHIIPNVLKVALGKKDSVDIFGSDYPTPDGTCVRDYIHIKDLAQAHIKALALPESDAFNLGNGGGYSVLEVVETSRKITGHAIPANMKPRRDGDPPVLVADAKKAKEKLGWQPQYPKLHDIIASAWQWHKKYPDGYQD
jgi:UDP-glucose 4-epimerase